MILTAQCKGFPKYENHDIRYDWEFYSILKRK